MNNRESYEEMIDELKHEYECLKKECINKVHGILSMTLIDTKLFSIANNLEDHIIASTKLEILSRYEKALKDKNPDNILPILQIELETVTRSLHKQIDTSSILKAAIGTIQYNAYIETRKFIQQTIARIEKSK